MSYHELALHAAEVAICDYMAVTAGESVLITVDCATDSNLIDLFVATINRLGASPVVLRSRKLPFQGHLADPYVTDLQAAAMSRCDVWLDLAFPYYAGCKAYDEALAQDHVRYLLLGDLDLESFSRMYGLVDFDDYFAAQDAFESVMSEAVGKPCRITTPLGTNLEFVMGPRSSFLKPRRATAPGMYLVPGACTIPADLGSARGSVVVSAAFHEFYEWLPSPVTLTVDKTIQKLSGGGASRAPLARAIRRACGSTGDLGSIIHYTHGIHPAARFTGKSFIEDMRSIGHNAIGLGIPWWLPGGGENHPDAVLTEQSLWIDGEQIISDGHITGPAFLLERIERLVPLDRKTQ